MEEEIPQGLILMRSISQKSFHESYPDLSYGRFLLSCLLRLIMGYLFLLNLFVTVVQADDVITIFFDILALEFVQHLDDMAFELGRKDILGLHLYHASNVEYKVLTRTAFKRMVEKEGDEENPLVEKIQHHEGDGNTDEKEWRFFCLRRRKAKWNFRWILKATYFFNLAFLLGGTILVGTRQDAYVYHCNSVSVAFGDQVWETAYVTNQTDIHGPPEERTLVYSYFNGIYKITGRDILGYPIYTEMNKITGDTYENRTGAEIAYCQAEEAWVFRHKDISKQNEFVDDEVSSSYTHFFVSSNLEQF